MYLVAVLFASKVKVRRMIVSFRVLVDWFSWSNTFLVLAVKSKPCSVLLEQVSSEGPHQLMQFKNCTLLIFLSNPLSSTSP